jgi:hypothetical protein
MSASQTASRNARHGHVRDIKQQLIQYVDLEAVGKVVWQNRPHDGLRDPLHPGRAFTPNEKYAALTETAGYVPQALSPDDHVELLPATWRAVNAYGIKISRRVYDRAELNPFRMQHSGVTARKGLWEVHYDPYDISRVWVRDHWNGGPRRLPAT